MRWSGFGMYAQSNKGYRVAKAYIGVDVAKYIAYCPNRQMLDHPAFFSFKDARDACEQHYNESNRQTEEDLL